MQVAVCIESICTIQTLSAHTVHSWVGFCIPHLHCACFRATLILASPTYIGRVFAFCTCILHRTLFALSWLWVSFAFSILHPASCTSLTAVALGPLLHSASCICILHRVPKVQHIQVRSGHQDLICAPFSHGQVCGYDSSPELTRCSLGPAGGCYVRPPGRVAPLALLRR